MASAHSNIHQLRPKLRLVFSNATPAKIARRTVATLQIASGNGGAILCSNIPSVD